VSHEGPGGNDTPHGDPGRADLTRRQALGLLAALPLAAATDPASLIARAWRHVEHHAAGAPAPYEPRFFSAHEWRIVRLLADDIIPRDGRSGSASDAGVPEFIDFIMMDQPHAQLAMRGGLHWLDTQSHVRFGASFADCDSERRSALLDDIAWPARAHPSMSQGVAFFTTFRDLVASGFWTSRMGIADLRYMGNTVVHEWQGCPPDALAKLGVSY
jgi:gluconate 2-dehydrogenase gamma chain